MRDWQNEAYKACKLLGKIRGWEIWPRVHKETVSTTVLRIITEGKDAELEKHGPS